MCSRPGGEVETRVSAKHLCEGSIPSQVSKRQHKLKTNIRICLYSDNKSRSFSPSKGSLKKGAKIQKSKTAAKKGKSPITTSAGETKSPIDEINDPAKNLMVLPFEEDKYLNTFLIKVSEI